MKRKLSLLFLIFFSAVASAKNMHPLPPLPPPPPPSCANTVCKGISGSETTCEDTSGYCYWMDGNAPVQCNGGCMTCSCLLYTSPSPRD